MFANVRSCFLWDYSCDPKYDCVISACIISSCVSVVVYVGFSYLLLMLLLYVGLRLCDVLFSCSLLFFPWPALEYKFLLA
jgi:hypothetical protein